MLGYWVLLAVTLYRGGIILPLIIGFRVFDITMFTYVDYLLVTLDYVLLLYAMRQVWLFKAYVMYILPIIIGTTLSVTISIVVILQSNGGALLLRSSTLNGGTHSLGTIHSAHFIVHFLTTIDLLLVLLFNWGFIKANYRTVYFSLSGRARAFHAGWFMLASLSILIIYMLNFNFIKNYPVHMQPWESVLLQVVISIAIGFIFWLGLVVGEHDSKKANRTPIFKWLSVL
jgi:hypothetical protein